MAKSDWDQPDPAELLILDDDSAWGSLAQRYSASNSTPLLRCLQVARDGGATTLVVETRYIDLDFRSELSAFYSRTFQSIEDSTHRLHFFRASLAAEQLWNLPTNHGYLGYIIIRPSKLGRVGRTVLAPPPEIRDGIRTAVTDRVHFFGQALEVEGVPFIQQDAQLGRCAHAAAWVCHYSAHLRGDVGRRVTGDFSLRANPSLSMGRPVPSSGLTLIQISDLLRQFDLPPIHYNVRDLPTEQLVPWARPDPTPPVDEPDKHPGFWDSRLIRICCRYLNSGLPVLATNSNHAFVLCGYERQSRVDEPDWITFYRHDDQRGPYLRVDNVLDDRDPDSDYIYSPWEALIVPVPEKLWLPPEPVESLGGQLLQRLEARIGEGSKLQTLIDAQRLALRTYAIAANEFKRGLLGRKIDATIMREYRLARWPRYVWVVEAVDRDLRASGASCVHGEAIFDGTSSELSPICLALHIPGVAWIGQTGGASRFPIVCDSSPYASGGSGAP